ncbi:hypothetical protein [Cypionkella psychrotolerans]|uniref:hypothetical protein n=1 Tax=Cypionkella psychrotolerans TaxID=1678131 RepID=UPI0006B5DFBD|nr:hypothetical protein [Cypionkella psychrotolerans]
MIATQIDATTWMVTEGETDLTPGQQHRVALPAGSSSAAAAIALVQSMFAPEPVLSPEAKAAAELAARRSNMVCSPLQGRLTAGPAICAALDATASDPATPWAMRVAIQNAREWRRTSQTIDEMAWLLGFDPAQMDSLFEAAMTVAV